MIYFLEIFNERKREIDSFIDMMFFLERKNDEKVLDEDITKFQEFFSTNGDGINISYQLMINIMKSNVALMIYNIIEFTISGLIDIIYDAIKEEELSYIDVNNEIQILWRKSILRSTLDPKANYNTFLKKNEEIIGCILNKKTLELASKNSLSGGNLDGIEILKTMKAHGIEFSPSSSNYRPEKLKDIKTKRNDLAHGSVSFTEALRDSVIGDINEDKGKIFSFLDDLVDAFSDYIAGERYKATLNVENVLAYESSE